MTAIASYETLAARAERAVLGALLLRRDVYSDIAYLEPTQFADPANAALFDAIRAELAREPDQSSSALTAHLQAAHAAAGASTDLAQFIDACPNPVGAAAYARMLVEADLFRTMNTHAVRLASGAAPESPEYLQALAIFHDEPTLSEEAEQAPTPGSWKGHRSNREEHILADLIQHPDQIEPVTEVFNAAMFTATARDALFEALVSLNKRGEPVDTLTVAWELDRAQAAGPHSAGVDPTAYVERLAAVSVEPGTALETARLIASQDQLVADRQARARQSTGPTHAGYVAERAVGREISRHQQHEQQYQPPTYHPPSPDIERGHGPRMGY